MQKHLSRVGQTHPTTITIKKAHPKASFKPIDSTGKRRLGDAELKGCPAEVQLLRHGHKVPQLPGFKVDHAPNPTA